MLRQLKKRVVDIFSYIVLYFILKYHGTIFPNLHVLDTHTEDLLITSFFAVASPHSQLDLGHPLLQ